MRVGDLQHTLVLVGSVERVASAKGASEQKQVKISCATEAEADWDKG